MVSFKIKEDFGFWDSYMAFRRLNYSYVGKENIRGNQCDQCGSGSEKLPFFLVNLRICNLWAGTTRKICGFAICGLIITNLRILDLRTGTSQKLNCKFDM